MSRNYPIIVVTGSSGSGTTTVKTAFEHIFMRQQVTPFIVEGDSFQRVPTVDRNYFRSHYRTVDGRESRSIAVTELLVLEKFLTPGP